MGMPVQANAAHAQSYIAHRPFRSDARGQTAFEATYAGHIARSVLSLFVRMAYDVMCGRTILKYSNVFTIA